MSGQAIVTVRDKQWQTGIATTPWDLTQGLGGLAELAPNAGMFFDTGYEQIIQVTTVPMLFPIDIAFFSESLAVTEVYPDVEPGFIVTPTSPARYFLEVNAGELKGIDLGDTAQVEVLSLAETPPSNADWTSMIVSFFGFMVIGVFMIAIVKNVVACIEPEKKPLLYGPSGERLLPHTKPAEYEIETDRLGNIIVTCSGEPGKDVFLQFESDKDLIYDLLRKGERKDLDAGWPIKIRRSEPRASVLDELWRSSAQPQKIPQTRNKQSQSKESLEFLPDSPEFLAYTIDDIGYRDKIDSAFLSAIQRAKGRQ